MRCIDHLYTIHIPGGQDSVECFGPRLVYIWTMSWKTQNLVDCKLEKFFFKKNAMAQFANKKIRTLNIFNHELFFSNMDFYMGYSPISGSKSTLGERVSYPAV